MESLCNKCGKIFIIKKMELVADQDIQKTFFTCTNCGEEYVVFYTNEEIRRYQDDIRKLAKFMSVIRSHGQNQELIEGIEELQQKIKRKMKALRIEIESKQDG